MKAPARPIQVASLFLLLLGSGISILWGLSLERGSLNGVMGFPNVYFGTKCLLQGCDPYDVKQLERFYDAAGLVNPTDSAAIRQSATLYVNLPATSLIVAPLALLPFRAAQALWLLTLILSFLLAAYLMWLTATAHAPRLSILLTFIVLANCEVIFSGGNTAGLVVGLAVIAAWLLLRQQFVAAGVLCLALALAIKPHDAGPVWLYFLIAGKPHTKRALQSAGLALGISLIACFWVGHLAPHWLPELRSNLATISGPGGINEPGPHSIGVNSANMIVDLQTVVSLFCDNARVYNPVAYAICAILFCAWLATARRVRTEAHAWVALTAIAAIAMLVTYHRSYDAKLVLLLLIPAAAMLWTEGGRFFRFASIAAVVAAIIDGDIPLAGLTHAIRGDMLLTGSYLARSAALVKMRPVPLILLVISICYLLVLRRQETGKHRESAG